MQANDRIQEGLRVRQGLFARFPLEFLILFLLVFANLPVEPELEFGRMLGDLSLSGDGWARFFERSLIDNPLGAIKTMVAVGLLLVYGLGAFGVFGLSPAGRRRFRVVMLGLFVLLLVVLPIAAEISLRYDVTPRGHAHDGGVIQTEEAVRFLAGGKNPYEADYSGTVMGELEWGEGNPAIDHLPYFPLSFLIHAPFLLAGGGPGNGYDARYIYLAAYFLPFFLVVRWARDPDSRFALAAIWGLNPFLVPHLVQGRNDVLVTAFLVVAVHLVATRRVAAAAVFLGLACATKQFALLFLPFFALLVSGGRGDWRERAMRGLRATAPAIIPLMLLVLPFFLWNPAAFYEDTFAFNTGSAKVSYPLGGTPGYGIANLVNLIPLVKDRFEYFPFWVIQVPVLIPLLFLLLRRQLKRNTPATALISFTLFLFAYLFLSRIFHVNYFGPIFFFLAAVPLAETLQEQDESG